MALDSLYQQVILDHARRRIGEGPLDPHDAAHFERNPSCGDELTMRIRLGTSSQGEAADTTGDSNGAGRIIEAIAWEGDGCSISMASASVLCDLSLGATTAETRERVDAFREMLRTRGGAEPSDEVEELLEDAVAFRGVAKFVMRVKCAMLSWVALEAALREAGS
ncbi:iron-sulfur cluster assembly scaffold protein NifU [Pseudoclavibacter endophyticus]|uniref:SUF system NifU family Fe-S cluster assembly protein n=1 Tax=Pseudoclavibacter endophyticus TaxID=1778590 RepID=A0A6H9WPF0_9MICO|nr:SUF system NifU family Fe-S cluster assembly protein [Pseudoclavibacter endophyticus]KAB1646979.1 SUF system NifU family Fe-S cluster assembly protein [Pseudoclavibacter endophyticus]GGA74156.1 iron-sulfur cluster assembly scaffold protein NifU [Pseudoclavibacter endophyticus]